VSGGCRLQIPSSYGKERFSLVYKFAAFQISCSDPLDPVRWLDYFTLLEFWSGKCGMECCAISCLGGFGAEFNILGLFLFKLGMGKYIRFVHCICEGVEMEENCRN
jgi:hypothetical protein